MRYVGVGRRFLALLIDGVVLLIAAAPFAETTRSPGYLRIEFPGALSAAPFVLWLAYFVIMEGGVGATLGKLALGLRVVKTDGSKLDWGAAFVRNLSRLVDGFPYVIPYLVGAIAVWSGPTRQRLGDIWAHTVVVERDSVPRPGSGWERPMTGSVPAPPPAGAPAPAGGTPPPTPPAIGSDVGPDVPPIPPPPPVPPGSDV
jgi:uncharacterized RDD family membrane protein YckC